jgi:hypothetical protein
MWFSIHEREIDVEITSGRGFNVNPEHSRFAHESGDSADSIRLHRRSPKRRG